MCGPTACGKSALALALADSQASRPIKGGKAQGGKTTGGRAKGGKARPVIINADAIQLYTDLPILSAGPSKDERDRIPHRLYGVLPHDHVCSAMEWLRMAREEVDHAHNDGKNVIIVGGAGLYIQSFLGLLAPIPPISSTIRQRVRHAHRRFGARRLHRCLQYHDPIGAEKLHPHDGHRIMRAIEVILATGHSLSYWHARNKQSSDNPNRAAPHALPPSARDAPFVITIDADRKDLSIRARERLNAMIKGGALEEVRRFSTLPDYTKSPLIHAYGVKPLLAYLHGECTLEQAIEQSQRQIERFIRRQVAWIRRYSPTPDWRHTGIFRQNNDLSALISRLSDPGPGPTP